MSDQGPRWTGRVANGSFFLAAAVFIAAAILLRVCHKPTSLVVVTFILGPVILLFFGSATLWEKFAETDRNEEEAEEKQRRLAAKTASADAPATETDGDEAHNSLASSRPQLSPAITTATALAVTVQGVVLGLIFAFNRAVTVTVKVGAVALAVGVIVGFLLYALTAFDVSGPRTQVTASLLFNLTLWCLFYGLLCIVAALVSLPNTPSSCRQSCAPYSTTTSTTPRTTTTTSVTSTTITREGNG